MDHPLNLLSFVFRTKDEIGAGKGQEKKDTKGRNHDTIITWTFLSQVKKYIKDFQKRFFCLLLFRQQRLSFIKKLTKLRL
jgi:hypothetical protein